MFLCDECAKPYAEYWFTTSRGKCEGCGKYGVCSDVPHNVWAAVDEENGQKHRAELLAESLAVSTYPCPVCGKTDFSEGCECGFMPELMREIMND